MREESEHSGRPQYKHDSYSPEAAAEWRQYAFRLEAEKEAAIKALKEIELRCLRWTDVDVNLSELLDIAREVLKSAKE